MNVIMNAIMVTDSGGRPLKTFGPFFNEPEARQFLNEFGWQRLGDCDPTVLRGHEDTWKKMGEGMLAYIRPFEVVFTGAPDRLLQGTAQLALP
jgi:hypothetical protein